VPCVSPAVFAHLAGVPNDPTLSTLVKKGAFYTLGQSYDRVFGAQVTRYDRNRGCTVIPDDMVTLTYKPATMTLSIKGTTQNE
jgi:hypothetical protein